MTSSDWSSALEFGLGLVELVLGLGVIGQLRHHRKSLPWLVVLMAFFLLRGADRIYFGITNSEPDAVTIVVDGVLILVLVSMLVGVRRTVRALDLLDQHARWRQEEYDRALLDFRRLARHRLANPLTAVTGALSTLEALPELEHEVRAELLREARAAAQRLQQIALEPVPDGKEEAGLAPRPRRWDSPE